jgi:hypothetical protein
MALRGPFNFFGIQKDAAYARVLGVQGGKFGWNGKIGVWPTEPPAPDPTQYAPPVFPAAQIDVAAPYVPGEDAMAAIYRAAAELPAFGQMASDEPPPIVISRSAFLQRFTQAERIAVRALAQTDAEADDVLWLLTMSDPVTLTNPLVPYGLNLLAAKGALTAERATQIATP